MEKIPHRGISMLTDKTKPLRPTVGHVNEAKVHDGHPEGKPRGKPERAPTERETADVAKWRDIQRESRLAEIRSTPNSDHLLSTIEPLAKEYYDLSQDLENTLQLSLAISTKRAAPPKPAGTEVVDNTLPPVAGETFVDESAG